MSEAVSTAGAKTETQWQARLGRVTPDTALGRWWLTIVAAGVLGYMFYTYGMRASLVIDGVRWFWLDDDQMISMRYGRNLAEGLGWVWNEGERVEGYTNPAWTLVMAIVHALGASDMHASAFIMAINYGLLIIALRVGLEIIAHIAPQARIAPMVFVAMFCTDRNVVWWAMGGFETALVTVLQMSFALALVRRRAGVLAFIALGAIPLVRGDGLHIFVANAALALFLLEDRRRTAIALALALAPTAGHFLFRHAYYGDWLPNTYYLKVVGLPDKTWRGIRYVVTFLQAQRFGLLACALGCVALIRRGDRRALVPLVVVAATMAYCPIVGGDNFVHQRYFSHAIPLVLAFACGTLFALSAQVLGRGLLAALLLAGTIPGKRVWNELLTPTSNGDPHQQIVVGALLRQNAQPDEVVAVIPAGIVPYFSRLRAHDMLGKTDAHIARLPYVPGGLHAHGKYDTAYSFGLEPDYVVSCRPQGHARTAGHRMRRAEHPGAEYVDAILASDEFRQHYIEGAVREPFLLQYTAVYTRAGSRAFERREDWSSVTFSQ